MCHTKQVRGPELNPQKPYAKKSQMLVYNPGAREVELERPFSSLACQPSLRAGIQENC